MKDFLGKEIEVGSKIAWPNRMGSSMWMSVGTVTGFGEKVVWDNRKKIPTVKVDTIKSSDNFEKKRATSLYVLDRIVVLESAGEGK